VTWRVIPTPYFTNTPLREAGDFNPSEHPRDAGGKFSGTGGGGGGKSVGGQPAAFGQKRQDDFPDVQGPPGEHLFHTTSKDNLADIASSGIEPHGPSYRGEQDAWPDGGRERRVYFSTRAGGALKFSEPDHVLLRVKTAPVRDKGLRAEFKDADYYTRKKVRPEDIEVMQDDGSWKPLAGGE